MKILRLFVSYLLIALLAIALPVWGESDVVGNAISSQFATLRDASLTAGSTVFSGDSIVVAPKGDATIALLGGDRLDVLGGSGVRVARDHAVIDFTVDQGSAEFRTVRGSSLQAMLGDATIRSVDGPSDGLIAMESENSAIVVAREGKLSLRSEDDGSTLVLNQGQAARVTLLPPQTNGNPPLITAKGPFLNRKKLVIFTLIAGGLLLTGGLIAAHYEHKLSRQELINEITPAKL